MPFPLPAKGDLVMAPLTAKGGGGDASGDGDGGWSADGGGGGDCVELMVVNIRPQTPPALCTLAID